MTKAYNLIQQEDRRKVCIRVIANSREKVAKDRRLRVKKGARESELGDVQDEEEKEVLRAFAEIENRRLNIERREAAQRKREAEQVEKEEREVRLSYGKADVAGGVLVLIGRALVWLTGCRWSTCLNASARGPSKTDGSTAWATGAAL